MHGLEVQTALSACREEDRSVCVWLRHRETNMLANTQRKTHHIGTKAWGGKLQS